MICPNSLTLITVGIVSTRLCTQAETPYRILLFYYSINFFLNPKLPMMPRWSASKGPHPHENVSGWVRSVGLVQEPRPAQWNLSPSSRASERAHRKSREARACAVEISRCCVLIFLLEAGSHSILPSLLYYLSHQQTEAAAVKRSLVLISTEYDQVKRALPRLQAGRLRYRTVLYCKQAAARVFAPGGGAGMGARGSTMTSCFYPRTFSQAVHACAADCRSASRSCPAASSLSKEALPVPVIIRPGLTHSARHILLLLPQSEDSNALLQECPIPAVRRRWVCVCV